MSFHRSLFRIVSALFQAALLVSNSVLLIAAEPSVLSSGGSKKLLIYILAGQSNMQGHAEVSHTRLPAQAR